MDSSHRPSQLLVSLLFTTPLWGCSQISDTDSTESTDSDSTESTDSDAPGSYAFESRFEEQSSVDYDGQTFRQVLIHDIAEVLGRLTDQIDAEGYVPREGEIEGQLTALFDFEDNGDLIGAATAHAVHCDPAPLQSTYADIGAGKSLASKIAGGDSKHQHKDWSLEFVGWGAKGSTNPDALVRQWFAEIERLSIARVAGSLPIDPTGKAITKVYVNASGQDLSQLLQKFLQVAVAFSQGADDYLDEGLQQDNASADDGGVSTALEHAWDEAFGYFGAARNYGDYTDAELAGKDGRADYAAGCYDTDGDGAIDLSSEYNFGHAVNAGKRDYGSHKNAPTDMTQGAFDAFLRGRHLIASANGTLSDSQKVELEGFRDLALANWEQAIAATVVHYINEILHDMDAVGTDGYDFLSHAKHWSEMKGFALGLQFSPFSPLLGQKFEELHALLADAPVLNEADLDEYASALLNARSILGAAYKFDTKNLGDSSGEGGW